MDTIHYAPTSKRIWNTQLSAKWLASSNHAYFDHSVQSLWNTSIFGASPSLNPHLSIYHTNIGVQIVVDLDFYTSTISFTFLAIAAISTRCDFVTVSNSFCYKQINSSQVKGERKENMTFASNFDIHNCKMEWEWLLANSWQINPTVGNLQKLGVFEQQWRVALSVKKGAIVSINSSSCGHSGHTSIYIGYLPAWERRSSWQRCQVQAKIKAAVVG